MMMSQGHMQMPTMGMAQHQQMHMMQEDDMMEMSRSMGMKERKTGALKMNMLQKRTKGAKMSRLGGLRGSSQLE